MQYDDNSYAFLVNPFAGTDGTGSTYPGAQAPFGMIQVSPDNDLGVSGYRAYCHKIDSFGLTHVQGVGCDNSMDVPFMPVSGREIVSPVGDRRRYSATRRNTKGWAGYFETELPSCHVRLRQTADVHTAMCEISYENSNDAWMVINPSGSRNGVDDASFCIDYTKQLVTGYAVSGGFANNPHRYKLYYAYSFDTAFDSHLLYHGQEPSQDLQAQGKEIGAVIRFHTEGGAPCCVRMKVSISYVSVENALLNMRTEMPHFDFERARVQVQADWEKILHSIDVSGSTYAYRRVFYTSLYRLCQCPVIYNDVNGEYMGCDDVVHTVRPGHNIYVHFSLWDTYRSQAAALALLFPDVSSDMVESMLANAREEPEDCSGLPIWSFAHDDTGIMCGYPADPYIATAYAFGARNFEVSYAHKKMLQTAEFLMKSGPTGGAWWCLDEYKKYGYVPFDVDTAACSRTLEYCVADFSVAQLCKALGDDDNYRKYLARSQSWKHIFDSETRYIRPRMVDGSFMSPFDPAQEAGFMEGNAAQYTWMVPHNISGLVECLGGREEAVRRLDMLCETMLGIGGWWTQVPYCWVGNEPCMADVWEYNWMGAPYRTQDAVRTAIGLWDDTFQGMPGNDDSGTMSAWFIFAALGLYPMIPGVAGFTVSAPLFDRAVIHLHGGDVLITAENASYDNRYIEKMYIGGAESQALWIPFDSLQNGAALHFILSGEPNLTRATSTDNAPPSFDSDI